MAKPADGYGAGKTCWNQLPTGATVLTTNFDHCLEDAKVLENKPHLLVAMKTANDLVRFNTSPAEPQLIYLHGSVEHARDYLGWSIL